MRKAGNRDRRQSHELRIVIGIGMFPELPDLASRDTDV
jgi:hypothetical protein